MSAGTCQAVVCQPGTVAVRELRLPSVGPRDVLVRTALSGVSTGTDRWVMQGQFVWVEITYPAVPGYQLYGVVDAVGSEIESFTPGQSVVVTAARDCLDAGSAWGAHASMVVADAADVYDAQGIPPRRAAFVVVAQVGYNAASRLSLDSGAHVLIVGDGIIGASAAMACRARGLEVLVVGRHDVRLDPLAKLGFETHNARHGDVDELEKFAPVGVIDTVQNKAAFELFGPLLPERRGQLVYSGHSPAGVTAWADMATLQQREWTVHFVSGTTQQRLEATLDLMRRGELTCELMVGRLADDRVTSAELMSDVASGRLEPVAAAIDWSWAR